MILFEMSSGLGGIGGRQLRLLLGGPQSDVLRDAGLWGLTPCVGRKVSIALSNTMLIPF